jgi:hypothetical protein
MSGAPMTVPGNADAPSFGPSRHLATATVLTAWCLLGVGVSAREGEYSPWGLALLTAGFGLTLAVVATRARLTAPPRGLLMLPAAVALVAAAVHPVDRYMHADGGLRTVQLLAVSAAAAAAVAVVVRRNELAWVVGATVALATGIATIIAASDPRIDVWYLLQQSSDGLLHGSDMYRQHWLHSNGLQAVYPYLPFTTVVLAPFKWLLGDVRYGLLAASMLTSWQLRRLAPAAPATLALLVLVHPHWAFLVDQSWTEPLLLVLLTGAVFAIERDRPGLAILALAGALAAKQHVVLVLPLFAVWPRFGLRRTATAAALAFAVVLPWLLAGAGDLWHDAVHANLALGVLPRALSLPSMLDRHGITVGFWFTLVFLAVAYVVTLTRAPRTTAGLALSCAVVLWAVDLANKQSFFNHYTLPLGLLVVAICAASAHGPRTPEAAT